MIVAADTPEEAREAAALFAENGDPDWPSIERYNRVHQEQLNVGTIAITSNV
jgi:hypothetical protein